jgi:hypothetical protein
MPAIAPVNANVTAVNDFIHRDPFMVAKHLFVANEVGLLEKLAKGPATLDELTERIGIPRRTVTAQQLGRHAVRVAWSRRAHAGAVGR